MKTKIKTKRAKYLLGFFLFIIVFLIFSPFKTNVKLCEDEIKVERSFRNYIKKNHLLAKTCDYQNKILHHNEFTYLDSIYKMYINQNTNLTRGGMNYYIELVSNSNSEKFIAYFKSLKQEEQFKIWAILKVMTVNEEENSLLKSLDEIYSNKK